MTTANDIIKELDLMFPEKLAAQWDNTQGLIAGRTSKRVRRVILSLEFRDNLSRMRADMLIFHHPPMFGPKREITNPAYGKWKRKDEVVYSIHSRMDRTGLPSKSLAEKIFHGTEYRLVKVLDDGTAVVELGKRVPPQTVIKLAKKHLKLKALNALVRKSGVKLVAVHGGEAFQLHHITDAAKEGIDMYLGGDLGHHLAERATSFERISFVDVGHFSEQEGMKALCTILHNRFPNVRFDYIEQKPLWTIE